MEKKLWDEDITLLEYLPPFMREFEELKQITNSETFEFKVLYELIKQEFKDMFIKTCSEKGILLFENLLNIKADESLDLETRKFNVLTKWNGELPYTRLALINKLNLLCGKGKYELNINHNEFIVDINTNFINENKSKFLISSLRNIIPANMIIHNNNIVHINFEKDLYFEGNFVQHIKYIIE